MKPEVVEFALKVCERILRSELADPQRFMEWIEALLSDAIAGLERAAIKVYLAPSDLTNLENHITHIEGISFHSDPLMLPGDCRIAGKSGLLNASIARQLEDVKAKVCGSEKKSKK
ncbi:MAG: FliH/SctL family protein, partial [Chlamydiales bacterium]